MTVTEFFNKLNNGTTWSAGVAFKRAAPLPLDRYSVFSSYNDATTYATTNAVAYPGQIIAVVEESGTGIYYIDQSMALQEVGKLPIGDGKSVVIGDDGIISLYGIDGTLDSAKSYQPVYKNGELTWVELSATTVEGLQTQLASLQNDVESIETKVGGIETDVNAIKADYLKAADKTSLETAIATAKTEAISEAKEQILGENVDANFDTLKEVADWIASDTTNSTQLINRVSAIEGDYLKGADKTELQGEIDSLETFVGSIPDGATSTTVVSYIKEVVDGLKIGEYAKASELTALATRVKTAEDDIAALKEVGAEKNFIASVDTNQFAVDGNRNLTLLDIAIGKVTGLSDALNNKVDKVAGSRLLTETESEKLEKLIIGEDGSLEISGKISAGNVDGLADWITERAGTLKGLSENNLTDSLIAKLNGIDDGAQVNVIETISVNGEAVMASNKSVDISIPVGTDAENGVSIADDKTMSVNSLNVNKLTQTEGEVLILNGGSSAN